MSGHSHWAGIKHQKEAADQKKGKVFSKIAKDIMLAVKESGADVDTNIKLRYALEKARLANMPKANVERAIKKMSGEDGAISLQELVYEGYGPGGTAIMVEVVTDSRNRVNSELRKIFDTRGGKMGESGCVSYLFEKKGVLHVETSVITEEKLMEIVLDAGADNIQQEDNLFVITCEIPSFQKVRAVLESSKVPTVYAEITAIPKNTVPVTGETAQKLLTLISLFEDHDDVQNVYCNYDISDEDLEKFEKKE